MNTLDLIDEHNIVRETVGYEVLNNIEIENIPEVIKFLKIVYNYKRMNNLENKNSKRASYCLLQMANIENSESDYINSER